MLDMHREAGDNLKSEGLHRNLALPALGDLLRLPWAREDFQKNFRFEVPLYEGHPHGTLPYNPINGEEWLLDGTLSQRLHPC